MSLRKTVNVSMSPRNKAFIERLGAELGMKESTIIVRTLDWLEAQDDVLHRGVLQLLPPSMLDDIKRLAIERLGPAKKRKKG